MNRLVKFKPSVFNIKDVLIDMLNFESEYADLIAFYFNKKNDKELSLHQQIKEANYNEIKELVNEINLPDFDCYSIINHSNCLLIRDTTFTKVDDFSTINNLIIFGNFYSSFVELFDFNGNHIDGLDSDYLQILNNGYYLKSEAKWPGIKLLHPIYDVNYNLFGEELSKNLGPASTIINNNKYFFRNGFVDSAFNQISTFCYSSGANFSENLAPTCFNGLWGYIDDDFNIKIEHSFGYAEPFSGGYARVLKLNNEYQNRLGDWLEFSVNENIFSNPFYKESNVNFIKSNLPVKCYWPKEFIKGEINIYDLIESYRCFSFSDVSGNSYVDKNEYDSLLKKGLPKTDSIKKATKKIDYNKYGTFVIINKNGEVVYTPKNGEIVSSVLDAKIFIKNVNEQNVFNLLDLELNIDNTYELTKDWYENYFELFHFKKKDNIKNYLVGENLIEEDINYPSYNKDLDFYDKNCILNIVKKEPRFASIIPKTLLNDASFVNELIISNDDVIHYSQFLLEFVIINNKNIL